MWLEGEDLESHIVSYFSQSFSASTKQGPMDCLDDLARRLTEEMQTALSRDYLAIEITDALKQMYATKAPGPESISPIFFQRHWHIVSSIVTRALLQALNSGVIPPNLSHTHIVLIPKKNNMLKWLTIAPLASVIFSISLFPRLLLIGLRLFFLV